MRRHDRAEYALMAAWASILLTATVALFVAFLGHRTTMAGTGEQGWSGPPSAGYVALAVSFVAWPILAAWAIPLRKSIVAWSAMGAYAAQSLILFSSLGAVHLVSGVPLLGVALGFHVASGVKTAAPAAG